MAKLVSTGKSCTVNPLKMSQPIGGALAFMGVKGCMPVLHGSQGCTSFGLVLFVRHFRESIPLQTTAMSEVATVMGGFENVEQAVVNIAKRANPELIGICSTGVTEIKGDDLDGFVQLIRARHPELDHIALVCVSTPDFKDAFQDGWSKTVAQMVDQLVVVPAPSSPRDPGRVNLLPGSHLTPGDVEALRDIIEAFGLRVTILPDISGSLDGHIPEDFTPTTLGGASLAEVRTMGAAVHTIAVGEQMRAAAETLERKTSTAFTLFDRLTGLQPTDTLMSLLSQISGRPVPDKFRRQRSQLVDAMLDAHFSHGAKKIAIGAEPDLLWSLGAFLAEMGCELTAAVTTTASPVLERLAIDEVVIGDLEDLEARARGCDLLITHSHGRQATERLGVPLLRMGLPIFDRLGAAHIVTVGYAGSRNLLFDIGNIFIGNIREPEPDAWRRPEMIPREIHAAPAAH
jgi:nitrogenase molybdenum-iron protein NifN